ncbi:methylated-DNA--[protein]-cysteine S-methyltransferase [Lutibacter sp. TH_r2]|uniref:methylated-DNA--[protein]-cysteine S-methyltransferase n=1 Tax=Lutibacter sp. TH_r2 TaxID=3082083 RepID=UPI0029554121|nr:methylated-DNA--[protein]-cysteine S-methyltransferase [Lutibacter sp. TH_r2]MDV7186240.1 methylated-DNA--[protein]-cysteine S-methyltransferase [Lutibacter sp. TH_r2]
MQIAYYKTPIGTAKVEGDNNGISSITVIDKPVDTSTEIPICLKNCFLQLDEYFEGKRTNFNLKLNPKGTEFQQKVWKALIKVPYGKTKTYLEQSKVLGDIKAIRAVASANGKNPIWIVIPCHRIIGSDGSLTGYASGLWRKKWLLEHESGIKQQSLF